MSDSTTVDTKVISDIVLSVQESIAEQLKPLLNNDSATNSDSESLHTFENISNNIVVQFENISMMAEMSGLSGLNAVCAQFITHFSALPFNTIQEAISAQSYLDTCLLNIIEYLSNWQSLDNIEQLTSSLSGDVDSICVLLIQDIENSNLDSELDTEINLDFPDEQKNLLADDADLTDEIADIDTLFAEDNDVNIDLDTEEGVMQLFCHELKELQPQLATLTQQILSNDNTTAQLAVQQYQQLITPIKSSCDELGLTGLVQICNFIIDNTNIVLSIDADNKKKSQPLLTGWPQIVINHLQAPTDDDLCRAVVDYLEDTAWPEPLKYAAMRDLIDGLTKQLELTGDFEVEARKVEALKEDITLDISEDTSQQLLDAFFAESPGFAEQLSSHITNIINGKSIVDNTNAAQRISHTLKGSANLIGTKGISSIAHHLEDIFEYLAKNSIAPPEALGYTMTEAADCIEMMIETLQGVSSAPQDAQRILQDVLNWANRIDKGDLDDTSADIVIDNKTDESESIEETADKPIEQAKPDVDDPISEINPVLTQTDLLHVPREIMEQIFNLIGETSIAIAQVQEQLKRMHQRGSDMQNNEKVLQSRRFELENLVSVRGLAATQKQLSFVAANQQFDSLEMDQYDEYYGATHSYIEAVSDNRESNRDVLSHINELEGLFLHQQRLNRSLENIVMTTRMVPIKTITARLQRAVRQACRATGKLAELEIIGEQLLIDGEVLNKLADPLMHILRNAIDHGIELLDDRREKGKSDSGKITLQFYQEGNNIIVKCSDDGAGLDYARIRWSAMERELINPEDEIDNASLARVILSSGFSTREKATQISGRGVGMDVVYTAVLKLKGSIDISDNDPSGTVFSLRLPVTLLTSHSILVEIQGERFAIPTIMLNQILPSGTGQFNSIGKKQIYQLGDNIYQTRSLTKMLGLAGTNKVSNINDSNNNIILLVNNGPKIFAVTVERVLSNHDLVVKNMGRYMKHITGIAGIALLGDGGVVPVLDMVELLDANVANIKKRRTSQNESNEIILLSKILIVDDSLSVRKSLSQLVQDAGYEPLLARDGLEALEIMKKNKPNLVLTDLEMPRMTGLELTSHIRSDSNNADLPIFMITSRTMAKHQSQAQKVGVNEYITKPFSEDDLISKLGQALNG